MLLAALVPAWLAPGDPLAIAPASAFQPPSLAHPFGTDESGREPPHPCHARRRRLVGIGVAATAIGVVLGGFLGFVAALGPPLVDRALARVFEVLFALPRTLVIALLFVAVMGGGAWSATLAIGLATIPGYARMIRARVRGIAASSYVDSGPPRRRIAGLRVHQTHCPELAVATRFGGNPRRDQSIVWVAALGFLGLGTEPPAPEWGAMLDAGRVYLGNAWWMTFFPGLAIVATATALTVIGRRLAAGGSK